MEKKDGVAFSITLALVIQPIANGRNYAMIAAFVKHIIEESDLLLMFLYQSMGRSRKQHRAYTTIRWIIASDCYSY